ncbi:MAG: hypothetical protein IT514_07860 [Burkholderiales bacterium]|nr:hypothetical protein [Burkholderiales bacterium]
MRPADTSPATPPPVVDLRSCEAWLSKSVLADPQQACTAFLDLLDDIEDAPPAPEAHVQILSRLRAPMIASLAELERRYGGKALPLGQAETNAFVAARDLWLALLRAWQSFDIPGSAVPGGQALLALRALESAAGLIVTHIVARREPDSDLWHWLHRCFARAEGQGVAGTPVQEGEQRTTCNACYAEVLLLHLARPTAASARELTWTRRWARRWAPKVVFRNSTESGAAAVDLDGCSAPEWTRADAAGESVRFLDCSDVGRSIRAHLKHLSEGDTPSDLGLGRDTTQPAAGNLLTTLLRCWTDVPMSRKFPRRRAEAVAQLACGLTDIYNVLASEPFDTGTRSRTYSHRETEQLHVFQRTLSVTDKAVPRSAGERWEMLDEAADGFRVRRNQQGVRIGHRQLVAIRPGGAPQFMLCDVRWLYEASDHSLNVGLRALPGLPQACSVRSPVEDPLHPLPWSPGFLIKPAGRADPTLVVAAGSFQNGRVLEMKVDGARQTIRLAALIERGNDFERLQFIGA